MASRAQRIVLLQDGEIVDEVRPRPTADGPGALGATVTGLLGR